MHISRVFEGHAVTLEIPQIELEEWLEVLKPYQRSTIESFLEKSSPEETARRWVSSTGSPNVAQFGGRLNSEPFWDRFKEEFNRFICDDDAYTKEKALLHEQGAVANYILVSVISGAIATKLGFVASLFVPAVALMLSVVAKMSANAFCASRV